MLLLIPAGFGTLLHSVDIVLLFYVYSAAALPKVKAMKCVLNYLFILYIMKNTADFIVDSKYHCKRKRTIIYYWSQILIFKQQQQNK